MNALAHETFHCFQGAIEGLDRFYAPPYGGWVTEGQAEWAAEQVSSRHDEAKWWKEYLLKPQVGLFDHEAGTGYFAIGFFSHLQESGIDPWTVMIPMLGAGSNAAAFDAALGGSGDAFLDSWAS